MRRSIAGIIAGALVGFPLGLTFTATADPYPPNLCTHAILENETMEWLGGGVDPDPVGIEWRAYDAQGNIIGYGTAADEATALLKAERAKKRNSGCAQYLPPDLVLPW